MTDGELPEGWSSALLPDVFTLNPGKPRQDAVGDSTPVTFVPMAAVDEKLGAITGAVERPFSEVRKGYTAFCDDDVILAKITPCFENGKAAVARGLRNGMGFGSTEFHVFRPTGAVLPEYLFHFLRQDSFRRDAASEMTGTAGQARVPGDFLRTVRISVPPLAEQRRIVAQVEALLAQVNAARNRLAKVPLILKRFRQAVLAAACSGRLTGAAEANLGPDDDELPAGWKWHELHTLAASVPSAICAGPFGTIFKAHDFRDTGVPIIFLRHVAPGEYRTAKPGFMDHGKWEELFRPYSVWGGELLVTKLGDPPGVCAIYPKGIGPAMVTPDVIKMTVDESKAIPRYLMHYLNSEPARQRAFGVAYGATRPRMNLEIFRGLRVPLPPTSEQREIVRRVDTLLAVTDGVGLRLQHTNAWANKLGQAILGRAFVGDLVPTEASLAGAEARGYESATALLERVGRGLGGPRSETSTRRAKG